MGLWPDSAGVFKVFMRRLESYLIEDIDQEVLIILNYIFRPAPKPPTIY